jgi:hypothetical protein
MNTMQIQLQLQLNKLILIKNKYKYVLYQYADIFIYCVPCTYKVSVYEMLHILVIMNVSNYGIV